MFVEALNKEVVIYQKLLVKEAGKLPACKTKEIKSRSIIFKAVHL
jgi:hypothetical protein